jgi:hypothetical protein
MGNEVHLLSQNAEQQIASGTGFLGRGGHDAPPSAVKRFDEKRLRAGNRQNSLHRHTLSRRLSLCIVQCGNIA